MADSQAWLTSWKMVARDCGSPWKEDMTLVPMAGVDRESQCLEYGHHPPSLLVHLWTLVGPVARNKGKELSAQGQGTEGMVTCGILDSTLMRCQGPNPATKVQECMSSAPAQSEQLKLGIHIRNSPKWIWE